MWASCSARSSSPEVWRNSKWPAVLSHTAKAQLGRGTAVSQGLSASRDHSTHSPPRSSGLVPRAIKALKQQSKMVFQGIHRGFCATIHRRLSWVLGAVGGSCPLCSPTTVLLHWEDITGISYLLLKADCICSPTNDIICSDQRTHLLWTVCALAL